jgi:hypothetical protein
MGSLFVEFGLCYDDLTGVRAQVQHFASLVDLNPTVVIGDATFIIPVVNRCVIDATGSKTFTKRTTLAGGREYICDQGTTNTPVVTESDVNTGVAIQLVGRFRNYNFKYLDAK